MTSEEPFAARTRDWRQQIEAWQASGHSQKAHRKANDNLPVVYQLLLR